MGVYIAYAFRAECSEEELLERLRRLRRKLKKLSFRSVGKLQRVDPAYGRLPLQLLQQHGYRLPPAVAKRLRGELGTEDDELCFGAAPPTLICVPEKLQAQFYRPSLQFAETTDLWHYEDREFLDAVHAVPFCASCPVRKAEGAATGLLRSADFEYFAYCVSFDQVHQMLML